MKKIIALLLSLSCVLVFAFGCGGDSQNSQSGKEDKPAIELLEFGNVKTAKNVILLIGDGMGPEEIKAGSIFKDGGLYIERLPNRTMVETRSNDSTITDSAAAGTALASGNRTNNGWVGITPDEEYVTTIVDIAHEMGKKTGIITTEELTGATPMTFAAHAKSRNDKGWLLESAARSSNVNLFVSTGDIESYSKMTAAGYTAIENVDDISESEEEKIIGAYPIEAIAESMSEYSFDRLVTEAIEYLSKCEDGFFLMAEGAHIDHGGHANDILYMLRELLAFDLGVKAAVEWARNRDDTVVLVTADHATGGLELKKNANADNLLDTDDDGNYLNFSYSTTGHVGIDVYLYVYGLEMDFKDFSSFNTKDRIKNTDVFRIMKTMYEGLSE